MADPAFDADEIFAALRSPDHPLMSPQVLQLEDRAHGHPAC